jgi:hypothetical protein
MHGQIRRGTLLEIVESAVGNPRLLAGALPGVLEAQWRVAVGPGK